MVPRTTMAIMHDPCPIPQPSNCPTRFIESLQLPEPLPPLHSESLQPPLHPIPNPESPQPSEPSSPSHSESLNSIYNPQLSQPLEPPFPLHPESLQPPLHSIPNLESPQLPPSSTTVDLESQQVISDVARQNLQWQNAILAFCFTSATQISLQFANSQSKLSPPFSLVSFAILLTFSLLLIAKMISRELTKVSRLLENVAILIASATFCYTTTIPFPVGFKYVIWSIFVVSLLIIVIYKCFCHVVA